MLYDDTVLRGRLTIRRGVTRTVLLTRRYAVKVPRLRRYRMRDGRRERRGMADLLWGLCRGVLANQSEATWSRNSPVEDALCPVLHSWLGGIVNVYPRCAPAEEDDTRFDEATQRWVAQLDLPVCPGDLKHDNLGRLNGRLVLVDYDMNWNGCPHDRSGAVRR